VSPPPNCPAVHLRRPAPLLTRILPVECIMVLNGFVAMRMVAINASARLALSGRRGAVLRLVE
jgi:hypothetical protein